jgi:hypothetical protein
MSAPLANVWDDEMAVLQPHQVHLFTEPGKSAWLGLRRLVRCWAKKCFALPSPPPWSRAVAAQDHRQPGWLAEHINADS